MDEQLAQVSLNEFIADLLLGSAELGPPLLTMPDCQEFLQQRYPELSTGLAAMDHNIVEDDPTTPLLVLKSTSFASVFDADFSLCSARSYTQPSTTQQH